MLAALSGLAVTLVLFPVSSAVASSVLVERTVVPPDGRDPGYTTAQVMFVADPGERNVVEVRSDATGLTITDGGSSIRAGVGCTSLDGGGARCEVVGSASLASGVVELGDSADSATADINGAVDALTIDGGADDDVLRSSGTISVSLQGGEGADDLRALGPRGSSLSGGAGNDTLVGADGNDQLQGGPGTDRLDGGTGSDTASWTDSSRAVHVDLGRGSGGPADELDHLNNVENIIGSSAPDFLVGSDGPNRISGGQAGIGPGDRIYGLDGDDELSGGRDNDHIEGGSGNDQITGGGGSDFADAGPGRDIVRLTGSGGTVSGGAGDDDLATMLDSPKARAHRMVCDAGDDIAGSFGRAVIASNCERGSIGLYDLRYPRLRSDRQITLTQLRRPTGILNTCNRLTIRTPSGRTLADRIVTRYPTQITTHPITGPVPTKVTVRIDLLGDSCRRRTDPRGQTAVVNLRRPAGMP
ncbi:calcium-binding protein [Conexibacter sp. W3-3-2]|uniref:calcium-binding protein n=1 Tax=Conexibacter sp. W3-3-2 TaxID=2675227 RepID=UPI00281669EE|nr:calcium-binding protein [Conexibacter sp. W3-3-2]